MNGDRTPSERFPSRRGDDLETLFLRNPPGPVDPLAVDRLATRAMERLRRHDRRRRARRRAVLVAATLASAAALLIVARMSWREIGAPVEGPAPGDRAIAQRPAPAPFGAETEATEATEAREPKGEATPPEETPVAAVTRALRTAARLRASRREVLRELRGGGPEVLAPLAQALETGEGETALAAAQLLASLATREADAVVRRYLEEGRGGGADEGRPAEAARTLVEELLRRSDAAGRRLVRSLLETPSAGRLIVRRVGRDESLWAADLLGEASASASLALSSEAIGLLSHRRPKRAASAFWEAAGRFAARANDGEARTETAGQADPSTGDADFLRETLPRMSARARAHLEDELRRASSSGPDGDSIESLAAALGRSGAEEAWPLLVAIVETDGARPAILSAFGTLGDARAVPLLERYVHLDGERADAAIRSLAEIPGAAGVRALLKAYTGLGGAGAGFFPEKRELLAESLRRRSDQTLAELRKRLADLPDQRTLGALVELFPGEAGEELAGLLESVGDRARPQVFRALAQLGTSEAVTILIDVLADPALSALARQSLTQIAHRDHGPRPESWREWLREQDPGWRRRAGFSPGPSHLEPLHHNRAEATPVLAFKTHSHHQEEA